MYKFNLGLKSNSPVCISKSLFQITKDSVQRGIINLTHFKLYKIQLGERGGGGGGVWNAFASHNSFLSARLKMSDNEFIDQLSFYFYLFTYDINCTFCPI